MCSVPRSRYSQLGFGPKGRSWARPSFVGKLGENNINRENNKFGHILT